MRVFLCDDNVSYRKLARRVLEGRGHAVVGEAGNGEEALALAPKAAPDVLLLDLNMPHLNGFAALPPLLAALPQTRIIILTTGQAPDERHRALDAGAHGFIVKPDRISSLCDEVDAAVAAAS